MNTKYYDIGLNLFCAQFKHPDKVLDRALDAGVTCILTGSDPEENRSIDRFLTDHPERAVYGTAGLHPHNADHFRQEDRDEAGRIYGQNPRVVAIGECGLDYNRMFSTGENQRRTLESFISLAEALNAPMFLHERDAAEDFAAIFSGAPEVAKRSVVHCFTGNKKTVEKYLSMGFSIGITGWICDDRRAGDLREAVTAIPPDRILLETDAPYLTPRNVPGLGRTNVPENIIYVARTLAGLMGLEEEDLIRHAKENTERIFRLG